MWKKKASTQKCSDEQTSKSEMTRPMTNDQQWRIFTIAKIDKAHIVKYGLCAI